jgi:hypothetical protein
VFQSVHSIENIHWHNGQPIPSEVLKSLETLNSSARLRYFTWSDRFSDTTENEIEEAKNNVNALQLMVNSKNLYSFTGIIYYCWQSNRQGDLGLVWQILTTCPNFRELHLTINRPGCILGGGQPYAFDFSSNRNASSTPLEVFKLNSYDLESTSNRE